MPVNYSYGRNKKTIQIPSYTFSNASMLSSLKMYYAGCVDLANVNAFDTTPMSTSTLTGSFGSIYVPASLVDVYKSATNWAVYADRITDIESHERPIITFTINGITHEAEQGMTWEEWCKSCFNNVHRVGYYPNFSDWSVDDFGRVYAYSGSPFTPHLWLELDGTDVVGTDLVLENIAYDSWQDDSDIIF